MNLRDALNVGVALAAAAFEKAEKTVQGLVKSGKLSATEGRKVLDDLRRRGERLSGDLGKRVDDEVQGALRKMRLVVRKDLEELRKEVEELRRKVQRKKT